MRNFTYILIIHFMLLALNAQAQEALSLGAFLDKVRAQSLDLKVERAKVEAADAKSSGLAIPPPMIGISQMKGDAASEAAYGFEVSQTIPFPSKLSSDHSARKYAAEAQKEARLAIEKEVLAAAKVSFVALWAAQEKVGLLLQKKSVIQNHIKLSTSSARSDSFAGIHILRAESDLDLLETEIIAGEQAVMEKQAAVAGFLNVDPAHFNITAVEPPLSEVPQAISAERSHQFQMANLSLESFKSKELEAKSSWYPDLNLRYKQVEPTAVTSRTSEVMVGVTLPFVFFWQPNASSKTAGAERIQAEFELAKQKQNIESEKAILLSKLQSQKKQLEVLNKKLIPRAEKRMKIIHNLAPRDMETLQDHRETMEAFPELKLKALALRLEYEDAVSSLEKYLPGSGDSP